MIERYWLRHASLSGHIGPFPREQLAIAVRSGALPEDGSVLRDGGQDHMQREASAAWTPVHELLGMPAPAPAPKVRSTTSTKVLEPNAITAALSQLPAWQRRAETLWREFVFADFAAAFAFMTAVADAAEEFGHHPDWRNVYRRVEITWTTHDAGGLTALDFDLARRCDELAASLGMPGG